MIRSRNLVKELQDAIPVCGSPRKTRKTYRNCCGCKCSRSKKTQSPIRAKKDRVFPCDDSKLEHAEAPELKTLEAFLAEQEKKTKVNKIKEKKTKLNDGVAPGSVMIMRAGKFKGKRVVFLMKLSNGLLVVTGLFKKVNGLTLRCVKESYVIATYTKVDISKMNVGKAKGKK